MTASSRNYDDPHRKLKHLCSKSRLLGGALGGQGLVAAAIGLSKTQFGDLFGTPNINGKTLIDPLHVAAVCRVFTDDGIRVDVGWWELDLAAFGRKVDGDSREAAVEDRNGSWIRTRDPASRGPVNLAFNLPESRLNDPDVLDVDVNLTFKTLKDVPWDSGNGEPVEYAIGLRGARLTIESHAWEPRPGSMRGERTTSNHYRYDGGDLVITGPVDPATTNLEGNPFKDDEGPLVTFEATHATEPGEQDILATVTAGRRSFNVVPSDLASAETESSMINKDAALNAIIYKDRPKDVFGRPIIAQARMRPNPPACPDPSDACEPSGRRAPASGGQ
jgi:hypothetical protein